MIDKIEVIQKNYEQILKIALVSNSIHDLCSKLGWKNENIKKRLRNLLIVNNFDISQFPKLHAENSIFNNELKLTEIIKNSFSYTQVIQSFVNKVAAGHYITLKKYIKKFNLDISHFTPYKLGKSNKKIINEEIFMCNSLAASRTVRDRILKDNLLPYKCSCGNEGQWLGQLMTLQLDHKNGIRTDNRLENLEFLCPNCHSITYTFGSKNKVTNKRDVGIKKKDTKLKIQNSKKLIKIEIIEKNKQEILKDIGSFKNYLQILSKYKLTESKKNYYALNNFLNANKTPEVIRFLQRTHKKINYPELSILKQMIIDSSYVQVAKNLNCTETALRKHLIRNDESYVKEIKKQISYPSIPDLLALIDEKGYVQAGKSLGCSDNAIRKYLKKNGVDKKSINSNILAA